jgi:hypothetical protein
MSKSASLAALNNRRNQVYTSTWEFAGKSISKLAVPKNISGATDSFLETSEVFKTLVSQYNIEELSLPDMILLSQAAKAIEDGDTKAAQFVRDTSGGKPVDKVERRDSRLVDLTDEQLEFILANAEVINE